MKMTNQQLTEAMVATLKRHNIEVTNDLILQLLASAQSFALSEVRVDRAANQRYWAGMLIKEAERMEAVLESEDDDEA